MDELETGVETAVSEPTTADTTVAAPESKTPTSVGELLNNQDQEQSEQEPSERTDPRDFRGMAKAKEAEAKEFKQLYKDAQAKIDALSSENQPTTHVIDPVNVISEEEALKVVQKLIKDGVDEAIAPLRGSFEEQKRDAVLTEFQNKPYVRELAPEITKEMSNFSPELKRLPLEQRLEIGLALAKANNIETITKVSRDIGAEQAYANQDLKRSQVGSGTRPSQALTPNDNLLERVKTGRVSDKEWIERKTEINQLLKEDALGSS